MNTFNLASCDTVRRASLLILGTVALSLVPILGCDRGEPEVIRETIIVDGSAQTGSRDVNDSMDPSAQQAGSEDAVPLEDRNRVLSSGSTPSQGGAKNIDVRYGDEGSELTDAQLNTAVSKAISTKEGREMLAPLVDRNLLQREAAANAGVTTGVNNNVALRPGVVNNEREAQAEDADPQRNMVNQNGYYGAGQTGSIAFVDPTGRPVSADGQFDQNNGLLVQPTPSNANVGPNFRDANGSSNSRGVNGSVNLPNTNSNGVGPTYRDTAGARTQQGTTGLNQPNTNGVGPTYRDTNGTVQTTNPNGSTGTTTTGSTTSTSTTNGSPGVSQVPARSGLPSQVPAGAGVNAGAGAASPGVSGQGAAGF